MPIIHLSATLAILSINHFSPNPNPFSKRKKKSNSNTINESNLNSSNLKFPFQTFPLSLPSCSSVFSLSIFVLQSHSIHHFFCTHIKPGINPCGRLTKIYSSFFVYCKFLDHYLFIYFYPIATFDR